MCVCEYVVARSQPITNAMRTSSPLSCDDTNFFEGKTDSRSASDDEKETSVFFSIFFFSFFVSVLVRMRDVRFNVVFQGNDKGKRLWRIL